MLSTRKGQFRIVVYVNFSITLSHVLTSANFIRMQSQNVETHNLGPLWEENSQWKTKMVSSSGSLDRKHLSSSSVVLTFTASRMWPPSYSNSNLQSIITNFFEYFPSNNAATLRIFELIDMWWHASKWLLYQHWYVSIRLKHTWRVECDCPLHTPIYLGKIIVLLTINWNFL